VCEFIERYVVTPKGKGARKPFRVRPFQEKLIEGVFDDPRPRSALWSMPRGNGKSSLAAALGLYGLFYDGVEGASVVVVASDERQASIIFNTAKRMVELSGPLLERCQVFQDRLYVPATGSVFQALPAAPPRLEGLDPSLCIVDEIGVVDRAVYEVMEAAIAKRDTSLTLMIGTPSPDGVESVMWDLVSHGRDHPEDESFRLVEFGVQDPNVDIADESAWEQSNPALDDFLYRDGVRSTLPPKLRESTFRRIRLGTWVEAVDEPWIRRELWAALVDVRSIPDGADVILSLDGSHSQDSTGVVVAEISETPHLDVVQLWSNTTGDPDWRVPVLEVEDVIRQACKRWNVKEIVADPFRWTRSLQVLQEERLPVLEYPQGPQRMTPATTSFYEAVVNQAITHSGDERLARHIAHAVVKADSRATRIVKEHKHSTRRIDLAVAAVMAHDRAKHYASQPKGPAVFFLEDFP
jgi:phage terminase large subunit-like protein